MGPDPARRAVRPPLHLVIISPRAGVKTYVHVADVRLKVRLVCHTIKGKGFPFAENNPSWPHKSNLSDDEIQKMYDSI